MALVTIATCPSCGKELDRIIHHAGEKNALAMTMLVQPEREKHSRESPECRNHPRWMHGWDENTFEDPNVQVDPNP